MSGIVLEVSHLRKGYKDRAVLKDVSFALEEGTATALLGAEGAGKSTLIRILAGLELPEEGTLSLLGSRNERELVQARRRTGFVLETPFGFENLTVYGNLELRARLYGKPDRARLRELRKALRLTENDHVGRREKLSLLAQGPSRRYALACALLNRPELLILDEPLAGLDKDSLAVVTEQLVRLREEGVTMLISGSEAGSLGSICSRALLLEDGAVRGPVSMEEAGEGPEIFPGEEQSPGT